MELTSEEIIKKLNNNEWLKDLRLTQEQLDGIKTCINSCTSPKIEDIFKAFSLFEPSETRVLILGQDPYTKGKATGLAFLLNQKVTENDSLYYILKAIKNKDDFTPKTFNEEEIENLKTNTENWVRKNTISDNKVYTLEFSII